MQPSPIVCGDARALFPDGVVTISGMTARRRRPKAPESLAEAGKALWRSVTGVYDLSPSELLLLTRCCRTADVLARLDAVLIEDDLVVTGSVGQLRAHPALAAKADQERVLDSLVRGMALPFPEEDTGRRRSPAAAAAAQARWQAERGSLA